MSTEEKSLDPDIKRAMQQKFGKSETVEEILSDPFYRHVFNDLQSSQKTRIEQSQNPDVTVANKRGWVNPEELMQYPHSPTALQTLHAFQFYMNGWYIINNYKKGSVETERDCQALEEGIHCYVKGYMMAGHLQRQFPILPDTTKMLHGYLKLRPSDTYAEFLLIVMECLIYEDESLSPMEKKKKQLRTLEIFAHKLEPYKTQEHEKDLLSCVYYILGSFYKISDQDLRGRDSIEKRYELDNEDVDSIYFLGYCYLHENPSQSIAMLEKYVKLAPKCHEKYPEAHYLTGCCYLIHHKDMKTANHYYKLGKKVEAYQLPFNPPRTDFPYKTMLEMLNLGIQMKGYTKH